MSELFLLQRVVYIAVFTVIVRYTLGFGGVITMGYVALNVFAFSFIWQYMLLHHVLKSMARRGRIITLILWLVVSMCVGGYGEYLLNSLDYLHRTEAELLKELTTALLIFNTGAAMFVAGACARRAFTKHGGL